MLKFDIRKQPNIPHLTDVLVDKLVEEANEVKEALYDNDINGNAYIQELLDVQQTLFAIFGNYKNHDTFGIIEHAMEEHNKKLATSHKEKYNLGDIMYIGYVDLNKPGDDPIEKLENKCENYSKQLKELINKNYDVENTNRVQEAKIEELRGIISNLKEKIRLKDLTIEKYKEAIDIKDKEIETSKAHLQRWIDLYNSLKSDNNEMLKSIMGYKETIDKQAAELKNRQNTISSLESTQVTLLEKNRELKEKAELGRVKKEEKIIKISELEANLVKYAAQIADLNNTKKQQVKTIELQFETIEELRDTIWERDKTIKELQYSKDNLVEENIDLKYKLNTETAAGQNKKLEFLEKKYNLSMEANRQLREEIQTLRIENGEYRDIINRIENYINELKTQQMD